MSMNNEHIEFNQQENGLFVPEQSTLSGLQPVQPTHEAYEQRLDEANETFAVIADPLTGKEFEFMGVNMDKAENGIIFFGSTMFSSATQNVGNVIEFAAAGAANPNVARVYMAYPGNGNSDSFSLNERLHLLKTGRLTKGSHEFAGSFVPLKTTAAAARAVETHVGYTPNHVSGDVEGARLGLAMMSAFTPNTVADAYLNGPNGVSHTKKYTAKLAAEDKEGRDARREQDGYMPGEVTPDSQRDARERLPNIYEGVRQKAVLASTYAKSIVNVPTNLIAYNKSKNTNLERLERHGLFLDTLAALMKQEAIITMQFRTESSIHDIDECVQLGKFVMQHIPEHLRSENRGIELLVGSGKLDAHTSEPAMRTVAERKGLGSIPRFMRIVMLSDTDKVHTIPALPDQVIAA